MIQAKVIRQFNDGTTAYHVIIDDLRHNARPVQVELFLWHGEVVMFDDCGEPTERRPVTRPDV